MHSLFLQQDVEMQGRITKSKGFLTPSEIQQPGIIQELARNSNT